MAENENKGLITLFSALRVTGPDSQRFLNGMLTNDISKAFDAAPACGRTFLLSAKARIVSEIFFYCSSATEAILICPHTESANVRAALEKYLIADKVTISEPEDIKILTLARSDFGSFERIIPRHPQGLESIFKVETLDGNIVFPRLQLSPSHVDILLLGSKVPEFTEVSKVDLWEFYWNAGQPQWAVDLLPNDFFLEFPLQDAVSFDKGCYIGQEVVARGTFRGKVNKAFTQIESPHPLPLGEFQIGGENSGIVRSTQGNRAQGIVKFSALTHPGEYKLTSLVNEKTFRGER